MNNRVFISTVFSFVLLSTAVYAQGIRKSVWAGQFYPKDPKVLSAEIDQFLKNTSPPPAHSGEIKGIIVPHAGYPYSGQVAAAAFNLVRDKGFDTVIILSPSHYYGFYGASIYSKGGYETPLGTVKIDDKVAEQLSRATGFGFIPQAHSQEHAVEVQIPFIQKVLPKARIVPIVMGIPQEKTIKKMARGLISVAKEKKVLILASTDMSHFLSKDQANKTDHQTMALVQSLQAETLIKKMEHRENIMCGGAPVSTLLLFAKKQNNPHIQILDYADSSDATGSKTKVVGYMAAALFTQNQPQPFTLSRNKKQTLLKMARTAISLYLKGDKIPDTTPADADLLAKRGAFVTLKKEGRLRGCIGFIEPIMPLYQAVIQAALFAAFRDTRFSPLRSSELKDLEIEISVLSPLKKIHDPSEIKVGRHGLIISKGTRTGLLLPQVAVENHWSRETFLRQACLKAGLPSNAWKKGAEISIFEALVFH